jgi:hypothetical protein
VLRNLFKTVELKDAPLKALLNNKNCNPLILYPPASNPLLPTHVIFLEVSWRFQRGETVPPFAGGLRGQKSPLSPMDKGNIKIPLMSAIFSLQFLTLTRPIGFNTPNSVHEILGKSLEMVDALDCFELSANGIGLLERLILS